jgi:hypothetical protein
MDSQSVEMFVCCAFESLKSKNPTRKTGVVGHPDSFQDLSFGPPAS